MGKKGSWFSSIIKTFSPISKEKKTQQKPEQKPIVEEHLSVPDTPIIENPSGSCESQPFPPPDMVKPLYVLAEPPLSASVAAAVPAVTAPFAEKSREEEAIKIQAVFRGYMARRALWGLRGLARLKTLVEGPSVKRQTVNTLKCIQSLSHLLSQISSRRIRMSEENQALQKQILRTKEIANVQNGDEWDDSVQSKEEIEAKLMSKYDAAMRRERAMAYSFSHQQPWKKSGGTRTTMLFMDPTNPQWGWSWSERYKDHASVITNTDTKSEITKSYARHQLNSAPSTPRSKAGGGLAASPKPKTSPSPRAYGSRLVANPDDDSKSVLSVKSEVNRRHSVAGSMAAARSPKVKPWGPGGVENDGGTATVVGDAKKQLSFQAKTIWHSGSPKVEAAGDGLKEGGG